VCREVSAAISLHLNQMFISTKFRDSNIPAGNLEIELRSFVSFASASGLNSTTASHFLSFLPTFVLFYSIMIIPASQASMSIPNMVGGGKLPIMLKIIN
jgi:hypothetical protein